MLHVLRNDFVRLFAVGFGGTTALLLSSPSIISQMFG